MVKTPRSQPLFKHQSFEAVYRQLALPLMKFLVKHMGADQVAAEEVFSQTISAAWKGWLTFQHKSSYFTWICRISLNKMADYYRGQINERSRVIAPGLEVLARIKSNDLLPEEKLALEELRSSVRDCLGLLPEEKRQLLYFRYWKDMSIKAIAQVLGISERAAEGKLYRAKYAFREILAQKHPEMITSDD